MSKQIFAKSTSVLLPTGDVSALFTFTVDGDKVAVPVIIKAQGAVSANAQFMQDMEGTVYYMVFGQKMTPMRFICHEPENVCGENDLSRTPDYLSLLKESITQSELPEATLVYGRTTIKGYINEIAFDSERGKGIYTVNLLGKVM